MTILLLAERETVQMRAPNQTLHDDPSARCVGEHPRYAGTRTVEQFVGITSPVSEQQQITGIASAAPIASTPESRTRRGSEVGRSSRPTRLPHRCGVDPNGSPDWRARPRSEANSRPPPGPSNAAGCEDARTLREGSACRAGSIRCSREVTGYLRDSMQCESGGTPPHLALSASQISRLTRCGGWRLWWLWPRAQHRGSAVAPMVTPVSSPHQAPAGIATHLVTGHPPDRYVDHAPRGREPSVPTNLGGGGDPSAVVEVVARLSRQPSAVSRQPTHTWPRATSCSPTGRDRFGFPETWRFDAFCNGHNQNATCAG